MNASAWMLATALVAGLLPPTPDPLAGNLAVGEAAPPIIAVDPSGNRLPKQTRGRPMFVNVFATTCNRCRSEIQEIIAAYGRYRARIVFLGIDEREPASRVAAFVKELRIPYRIGIDPGPMAATYGAGSLPHSVFIDRRGIVTVVSSAPLSRGELERLLAGIARG